MPLAWDKQYFNAHDIDSMASQDTELDAVPRKKRNQWRLLGNFSLSPRSVLLRNQ